MIDERRPSSEITVVDVAPVRGRTRTDEPPLARTASDVPPRLANRRPARGSVDAPYTIDDFPVRVVRSMHEAARAHRARLEEEIELRRVALTTAIREQRRADVMRARKEAAQNRRGVDAWAATSQRQIKSERQRRKVEIDNELRRSLREMNQQVDRRVKEIESALAAHRAAIDAFFEEIERERDPVAIAERASERPALRLLAPPEPSKPGTIDDGSPDPPAWIQAELFDLEP